MQAQNEPEPDFCAKAKMRVPAVRVEQHESESSESLPLSGVLVCRHLGQTAEPGLPKRFLAES